MTDNTLTGLIPVIYQSVAQVSRELVGFIPSVTRNSSAARAALNEVITVPVSRAAASVPVAPSMTIPDPAAFTEDTVNIAITKSQCVAFALNGEETQGLNNGVGANYIMGENFKQAIRTLVNEIEVDIGTAGYLGACRGWGPDTPADPFGSYVKDAAQAVKMLDDNGAPIGRSLVINSGAALNLRGLTNLTNVNEAGTNMTLRQGELLDLFGLSVKQSAGVQAPVIGVVGTTTSKGSLAIGATAITLKAIASGGFVNGDYIMLAGDTNRYLVVAGGKASNAPDDVLTIAAPGLRQAHSDGDGITIAAKTARNLAFSQSAIQLVTRAPAMVGGDDAAVDKMMITDPYSGMSFELRVYNGYHKKRAEIGCAWGVKVIQPEHVVSLLGLG
jgi:hypothetical protein